MQADKPGVLKALRRQEQAPVRPYSAVLHRGAIGSLARLDARSVQGRVVRQLEAELTEHVGGAPSITQRLLIERCIKMKLQLEAFERKLDSAEGWTAVDNRTYGALNNAYRLTLRELGSRPHRTHKVEGLDEVILGFKQPAPPSEKRGPGRQKKTA